MPDTSILDNITSAYDATNPTVNSVNSYVPDDMVEEKLKNEDIFPGADKGITAGTYSGSEVGSLTLFAPQGQLVPFAAYGARDRAIEKAAQQRLKDLENYQKSIKAPETKLQNVNSHLHDAYYDMIDSEQARLQKKYGKNWVKMVGQDVEFQRNNQNYIDAAKYYDGFVKKYGDDDELIAKGEMVPTKEYGDTRNGIMAGLEFIKDPSHPQTQKLSENFLKFDLERSFMSAADKVMSHQIKQTMEKNGIDPNDPDLYKVWSRKQENYTPEQLKKSAEEIKQDFYATNPRWTIPEIENRLKSSYGNIKEEKTLSISQKRAGGNDEEFDPQDMESSEHKINVQPLPTVASQQSGASQKETSFDMGNYSAYTKPVKVNSAIGSTIYPTSIVERKKDGKTIKEGGLFPTQQPEDKTVTLGGIGIGDVEESTGVPVTAEQIAANPKMKTRKAVLVHGSYGSVVNSETTTTDEYGNVVEGAGDKKPGTEVPFLARAMDYKNVLKNKKVKGGMAQYDYLQKKVDEMNGAKPKLSAAPAKEVSKKADIDTGKTTTVKGKTYKVYQRADGSKYAK